MKKRIKGIFSFLVIVIILITYIPVLNVGAASNTYSTAITISSSMIGSTITNTLTSGQALWYKVYIISDGELSISLSGLSADLDVAAYTENINNYYPIALSENDTTSNEFLKFYATTSAYYYIKVYQSSSTTTSFKLRVNCAGYTNVTLGDHYYRDYVGNYANTNYDNFIVGTEEYKNTTDGGDSTNFTSNAMKAGELYSRSGSATDTYCWFQTLSSTTHSNGIKKVTQSSQTWYLPEKFALHWGQSIAGSGQIFAEKCSASTLGYAYDNFSTFKAGIRKGDVIQFSKLFQDSESGFSMDRVMTFIVTNDAQGTNLINMKSHGAGGEPYSVDLKNYIYSLMSGNKKTNWVYVYRIKND